MTDDMANVWRQLAPVERDVLLLIARRLLMGQHQYGELDLADKSRDWAREAGEECADRAVYLAINALTERGTL